MAVLQASTVGVVLHHQQSPRLVAGRGLGSEFSNLAALRAGKGNRRRNGSVAMEQEGHIRRADFRVRAALETTLTTPSSTAAATAAPVKNSSLGDLTKGDFPILNQVSGRI